LRSVLPVLPALLPPLALLALIATYAVNAPRWDDWDIIPFVVAVHDGTVRPADFWMQHNEHRLAAVKLILAPLVLATGFDVTAMMYAGFALELLALVFLLATLRMTLPAGARPLAIALSLALSLLMFSPAQHENWIWGLTALQWHLVNATAAAAVWLLARRPRRRFAFVACWLLTFAGMNAVASGLMLWGVVLVVIVTESLAARRPPAARSVLAWCGGLLALTVGYFSGFRPNPGPSYVTYFLAHPGEFAAFVLVYLGNPFVQGASLRWAAAIGLAGLLAFLVALYAAVVRGFLVERVLPWLWLSSFALMVAVVTGVGRTRFGPFVATTNRYTTGALFFWIGLVVIAGMALRNPALEARAPAVRVLRLAAALTLIVACVNYARLYRDGYRRFVQTHHDRMVALAELSAYETAPDDALLFLYPPGAARVRQYMRMLEARGLGPFAPHMARHRARLVAAIATADVDAGAGALDPPLCAMITGWAWDPRQPDMPVKVDLDAGEERLATLPAYWYRPDLVAAGLGDGRHAYFYNPPARLKDGRPRMIRARISGTAVELAGSPRPFVCSDRQAALWR